MIKTLSPHYLEIPFINPTSLVVCDRFVLKVYIWDGAKNAVPSTATYSITKVNAVDSDGFDRINISRIINDFIDFNITVSGSTSLEDGNNQVWVKTEVYYNDMPTAPQLQSTKLAVKGYGYFQDGENPSIPANKILLTGDEFKVNRNGFFILPILLDETEPPEPSLVIDNIVDDQLYFTTNFEYSEITCDFTPDGGTEVYWSFVVVGNDNPLFFLPPDTPGTYDVQISAYNSLTDTIVYSPIYSTIIT
jgi:hypothetical protein